MLVPRGRRKDLYVVQGEKRGATSLVYVQVEHIVVYPANILDLRPRQENIVGERWAGVFVEAYRAEGRIETLFDGTSRAGRASESHKRLDDA